MLKTHTFVLLKIYFDKNQFLLSQLITAELLHYYELKNISTGLQGGENVNWRNNKAFAQMENLPWDHIAVNGNICCELRLEK